MKFFCHYSVKQRLTLQNPKTGAWHVNVPFNLKKSKYPFAEEIGPGWISAMGSAHAMSVLTRAFRHSGKKKYLEAAIKALQPFSLLSNKGGVKALFMGKMTWYEEYPTSYVFHLNNCFNFHVCLSIQFPILFWFPLRVSVFCSHITKCRL